MAVGAVISSMAIVPGAVTVRIRLRIIVIRSHVVPVRVIIVGCWIGVKTTRKSETDSSSSRKCGGDLSVSRLCSNESQSTCRQSNQEKLFHKITLSYLLGPKPQPGFPPALRPSLYHKIGCERASDSRVHFILPRPRLTLGRRHTAVQKKSWLETVSEPAQLT
jgi:hypothetical protein